jgi:hypothetical protein
MCVFLLPCFLGIRLESRKNFDDRSPRMATIEGLVCGLQLTIIYFLDVKPFHRPTNSKGLSMFLTRFEPITVLYFVRTPT